MNLLIQKKLASYFIAMCVSILLINTAVAVACSPGYTPGPNPVTVVANGCTYTVNYCYKLSPGGVLQTEIESITSTPGCMSYANITSSAFHNNLTVAIAKDIQNNVSGPFGGSMFPPCGSGHSLNFVTEFRSCTYLQYDNQNIEISLLPCENVEAKCRRYYDICWEDGKPVSTYLSTTSDPTSQCTEAYGQVPVPNSVPLGWRSDCMMYPCQ